MKYLDFYKENIINEASSDFKYFDVSNNKCKVKLYWEYKLLPATVDIEFGFRINFKKDNIINDFSDKNNIDYETFYKEILVKKLSEKNVRRLAEKINVNGFKCLFVTYSGESELNTLDPTRTNKQYFSHTITFEATNNNKYEKNNIPKIFESFIKEFVKIVYVDNEYYFITKN